MEKLKICRECLYYFEHEKLCYTHGINRYWNEEACTEFYQISDKAKYGENDYSICDSEKCQRSK